MHAIFVSTEMLDRDTEFEERLLDKAQKQQDLVVMSYDNSDDGGLVFNGSIT
jgi:predicted TIM-barrel fold metal-dependent hydrolase